MSSKRATINLQSLIDASSPAVYRRGVQYWRRKKVLKYEEKDEGAYVEALVIGSEPQPYKVVVTVEDGDKFKAVCSCPYFEEICKHSVSVVLTHVARSFPGIRFDSGESLKEPPAEHGPRAKELLEDHKVVLAELANNSVDREFTLGILVLEKPLAFIVGTLPDEPQGKVNILKVPEPMLQIFPEESRIHKLVKYLLSLPQATKGPAGGHRIPRGDEGVVLGHLSLCANLINTTDNQSMSFCSQPAQPKIHICETENGELSITLKALNEAGEILSDPVFFLGQQSWVLSKQVFYAIDLSPIHRLFQFFDSHGNMTVKLETVPKFLAIDLPILKKRMDVELDENNAPFPTAITEPPKAAIRVQEKQGARAASTAAAGISPELELVLGFRYGDLVLPSRDETSAMEAEPYTRTIADTGQSVWVKRLWEQEGQLRRFLTNLLPTRTIADRFFFHDEPALDALYYIFSEECADWEVSGFDQIKHYRVAKEPVKLKAVLSLKKDSYNFEFELQAITGSGGLIPFPQVIEAVFRNRNYLRLEDSTFVRLPVATLLSVLKGVGASKEPVRPLYQALPIAHLLETQGIEITADEGFKEFIQKLRNFRELEPMKIPGTFNGTLREYQREGYNWLSFLREYGLAGILADDMGLGKTIQALVLLLSHHKNGKQRAPSLVVAPTSVVYNWLAEAEKFSPQLSTSLFLGRDRSELLKRLKQGGPDLPDLIFTTYGIIRRDYEQLKEVQFDYLILDEAQNIKNPESVGAIASKSLKALHRVCLSGTPVENRLRELWSLFDFLMPEFLGNYRDFNETFERPIESGIGEAGQKLRKTVHPFILRRLKSQVEKELPPRTDIIHQCEMDDEQRSLYLSVLDECRQKVFGEIANRGLNRSQISVLAALLRLRQVCCDPRLLKDRGDAPTPPSAKLISLIEMIGEIAESGHKILVFSQFVEMLSLVRTELENKKYVYEYIDGQTPAKERLEKVNRFNEDQSIPIFLISLKAGGTGLNLTGADYVIHYDPWWNPAVENQATDRAHRIGQTRHVFNYKLITRGTVEEKILALQKKKKELADMVIGGDESIAKELTREDLEFLFSF
ncbi:MAG: DEAD/DEAH box helicase [Candidatus Obscuribacterales bacterium]|nr:DEAD/DEAH box helicase [Candidatus Obscuribacterales bacterium]